MANKKSTSKTDKSKPNKSEKAKKNHRDAESGRYVTQKYTKNNPKTTVTEKDSEKKDKKHK